MLARLSCLISGARAPAQGVIPSEKSVAGPKTALPKLAGQSQGGSHQKLGGDRPATDRPQPGAKPVPARFLQWHPPGAHARELLHWAHRKGHEGSLLASDLTLLHRQMCDALGWATRPWNPIGRALREITSGGKKLYVRVEGRRLRVYPICLPVDAEPALPATTSPSVRRAA